MHMLYPIREGSTLEHTKGSNFIQAKKILDLLYVLRFQVSNFQWSHIRRYSITLLELLGA